MRQNKILRLNNYFIFAIIYNYNYKIDFFLFFLEKIDIRSKKA